MQDGQGNEIDLAEHEEELKEFLKGKGLVVLTKEEKDKEILTEVNKSVKQTHSDWEKKVSDFSGKKKPDGIKGLDWVPEVFKKEEDANPAPDPDPKEKSVKDEVASAKIKELEKKLEDIDKKNSDKEEKANQRVITSGIKSVVKGLEFDGDDEAEKKDARQTVEELLMTKYTWKQDEDDNLIPYDKDGNVVIDPETTEPYEINKLVKKKFGKFLVSDKAAKDPIKGTGGIPKEEIKIGKDGVKYVIAKTREAIREKALELGLRMGSPEYTKFMLESCRQSKIEF